MPAPWTAQRSRRVLRLEFGSRRLVASGWMTVLALAGVLLFVQLGRWQWHRAAEKTALAAAFAAGTSAPALALGTRSTASLPRFAQVIVTGRYDPAHQFLLDNMSEGGQVGYQVLTPLRLEGGRWLLVNRGRVPGRGAAPGLWTAVVGFGGADGVSLWFPERGAARLRTSPPRMKNGRWTLTGLLLLFAAPLGIAFWLYYGSSWRPASHTNHGRLFAPMVSVPGAAFTGKWSLVVIGAGAS